MSALKGKKFDVVIDNPTTAPAWVRNVAQYMKGNTDHYIFISTISVYATTSKPRADESDPHDADARRVSIRTARGTEALAAGQHYGALKAYLGEGSEKTVSGHLHDHPSGTHRRSARSHRSLHLLAVSHRQGRRSARAGRRQRSRAVHRRRAISPSG